MADSPTPSHTVRVLLETSAEQTARLGALQAEFARACNALAPLVQSTACWNRVALHHMAYRQLRQQFPGLGSQMACNVVYSVSRTCRIVYQDRASPFNLQRLAGRPLPLLRFSPQSPVYFDRHTLSVKDGLASMYTLDGRMRFKLQLGPADDRRFRTEKLREIVLLRQGERFLLSFSFAPADGAEPAPAPATAAPAGAPSVLPKYIVVVRAPKPGKGGPANDTAGPALHTFPTAAPVGHLQPTPGNPIQP